MKKVRRSLLFFISFGYLLTMAVPLMPKGQVYAMSGSGTSGNPYVISSCDDLQNIDNDLSAYYQLNGNIDCSASSGWNGGLGFSPISSSDLSGGFTGTLEGNGFAVEGLTINRGSSDNQGLFAILKGTVQDLRLTSLSVTGRNYVGGLAGEDSGASVNRVKVNGTVGGQVDTGGLIGYLSGNGSVTSKSAFSGNVAGSTGITGGLVADDDEASIDNSYANATVTGGGVSGGVVGRVTADYFEVDLTNTYAAGSVDGTGAIGGVVGSANGNHDIDITSSFNAANAHGGYAIVGDSSGAGTVVLDNDAVDINASGGATCIPDDSESDCTTDFNVLFVDSDGTDPGYFATSYPLSGHNYMASWNFDNIWQPGTTYLTLKWLDAPLGATVSGAPTNLQATADEANSEVDLSWGAPASNGGSTVLGYQISYSDESGGGWTDPVSVTSSTTSYTVSGLTTGDTYDFRVAAVNIVGASPDAEIDGTALGDSGGDGSPYDITDCAQLQNMNEDLTGDYTLENDIDCSGTVHWNDGAGFLPIGRGGETSFTGTLRGNGHTISGLYISDSTDFGVGMFSVLSGTVENLNLVNETVYGADETGGVAGIETNNGLVEDVSVNGTIVGYGDDEGAFNNFANTGGIAGVVVFNSGIVASHSSGLVTTSLHGSSFVASAGGLAGMVLDDSGILASYSTSDVKSLAGEADISIGGVVGTMFVIAEGGAPELQDVYTTGNLTALAGNVVGGIAGFEVAGSIDDSFAVSHLVLNGADNSSIGAGTIAGVVYSGTMNDTYYDADMNGPMGCSSTGNIDGCNAVNVDGSSPNYFINSETNGPLSTWPFDYFWGVQNNAYPTINDESFEPFESLTFGTTTAGRTSVTLNWTAPTDEQAPLSYLLRYRAQGTDEQWTYITSLDPSATSAVISGLTKGTTYDIQLRYTNSYTTSAWKDFTAAPAVPRNGGHSHKHAGGSILSGNVSTSGTTGHTVTQLVRHAATFTTSPITLASSLQGTSSNSHKPFIISKAQSRNHPVYLVVAGVVILITGSFWSFFKLLRRRS